MSVISRNELLKEILPALDELFGVEYDGKRAIGGNEIVHNVRGYTFDLSLWNGTQGSEEH